MNQRLTPAERASFDRFHCAVSIKCLELCDESAHKLAVRLESVGHRPVEGTLAWLADRWRIGKPVGKTAAALVLTALTYAPEDCPTEDASHEFDLAAAALTGMR